MNRRAFFGGLIGVVAVTGARVEAKPRLAVSSTRPQCPKCLSVLPFPYVCADPPERRLKPYDVECVNHDWSGSAVFLKELA